MGICVFNFASSFGFCIVSLFSNKTWNVINRFERWVTKMFIYADKDYQRYGTVYFLFFTICEFFSILCSIYVTSYVIDIFILFVR